MTNLPPGFPLIEIALPSINEVSDIKINPTQKEKLKRDIIAFIDQKISYDLILKEIMQYPNIINSVNKIKLILDTQNNPIPEDNFKFSQTKAKKHKKRCEHSTVRAETNHWTEYEDFRLLMGIRLFGLEDWNSVARYVGNGRLRSQCMQRWSRGLDPRISKSPWTKEEEKELISLVEEHKNTAWTQIAAKLGNRTDVQCRYKYRQLCKSNHLSQNIEMAKVLKEKSQESSQDSSSPSFNVYEPKVKENSRKAEEKSRVKESKNEADKKLTNIFNEIFNNNSELGNSFNGGNAVEKNSANYIAFDFTNDFPFEDMNITF